MSDLSDWLLVIATLLFCVVIGGASVNAYKNYQMEIYKYQMHIKCVEMREMPIGACSRLFGEGQ
jgi:hypothetical protein